MCGIAGILSNATDDRLSATGTAMLRSLAHRGPDDEGWLAYRLGQVRSGRGAPQATGAEALLLHRRLAIIDLSEAGWQPMSTSDGRYHIIFNGEIYNYIELREELNRAGIAIRTRSDTEVLLAALAHWGVEALPRLVGMFALALLDVQERTLLLARDPFGIKPLFYTAAPGRFAFASEINALLEVPGVARRVDAGQLWLFLNSGATDYGPETMLQATRRLPAAHSMVVRLDGAECQTPQAYWRLDPERILDISFAEAAATLRDLFLHSIRLHLRSDVPVGTALSGGIDSSAIAAAVRTVGGKGVDFHSFSFIADDPAINEERWLDMAAAASGATVHKIHVRPQELAADLDDLVRSQGEPFGGTSIYAQYRVFRAARDANVKVLLDGQGGDELLGGYQGYLLARLVSLLTARRYGQACAYLGHVFRKRLLSPRTVLQSLVPGAPRSRPAPRAARASLERAVSGGINLAWFQQQGLSAESLRPETVRRPLRASLLDTLVRTTLPMYLRYEDRNSMAFGVESRVPFLTPQIAEFVFSLPEHFLIDRHGTRKSVFRAAMRGIVPDGILDRRDKIGFATPERSWLRAVGPWVEDIVGGKTVAEIPALDAAAVRRQTGAILAGRQSLEPRLWRWISLIRWSERFDVEY